MADIHQRIRTRFKIHMYGISLLFVILIVQYARIMLVPHNVQSAPQNNNAQRYTRGTIYDRNGRILAIQNTAYNVSIWKPYVDDVAKLADTLADILAMKRDAIEARVAKERGDIIIKRNISHTQKKRINTLKKQGLLKAVILRKTSSRQYPEQTIAAHAIGFTGQDNQGLAGIEYSMDTFLSGTKRQPVGDDIYLTLDLYIQSYIEKILNSIQDEHNPDFTTILVLEAKSGDILAYGARPTFDPNTYKRFPPEDRRNRPISDIYEPGSVFKIFSLASFYQLGGITPQSQFDASHAYQNKQMQTYITDLNNYGTITPEQIIRYSSNVGTAYASDTVAAYPFYFSLLDFGFSEKTGIQLSGEEQGILREPKLWSARSKPTIAIGQEIATTALQIATAATVFANQGDLLQPHIVKYVVNSNGTLIQNNKRYVQRNVVSPQVAQFILEHMKTASQPYADHAGRFGTGRRAYIPGLNISIKTGTAQIINNNTYSTQEFLASAIALFPTENPEIIIYVMIKNPRGKNYYGGIIASPIIKKIVDYSSNYRAIHKNGDTRVQQAKNITITVAAQLPPVTTFIPSFIGVPLHLLMPLYKDSRITLRIQGSSGVVVRQDPPPYTKLSDHTTLTLYMEANDTTA